MHINIYRTTQCKRRIRMITARHMWCRSLSSKSIWKITPYGKISCFQRYKTSSWGHLREFKTVRLLIAKQDASRSMVSTSCLMKTLILGSWRLTWVQLAVSEHHFWRKCLMTWHSTLSAGLSEKSCSVVCLRPSPY